MMTVTGLMHGTKHEEAMPLPGRMRARRRAATRSGFSLVEVLVAIAVLTIGIIAFLEIFPNGFLSLQIAANVSSADRLAQQELNQLSPGNGAEIQQVAAITRIYQSDTDNGLPGMVQLDPAFNLDRGLSPGAGLTTATSTGFNVAATSTVTNPLSPEPYEYIGGERVGVPSATALAAGTSTASGNVLLDFGPITLPAVSSGAYAYPDLNTYNSLDPNTHYAFFVHGLPWASQPGTSQTLTGQVASGAAIPQSISADDPESELKLNSPQYLIDYNNCAIALRNPNLLDASGNYISPYAQTFAFQVTALEPSSTTPTQHTFLFTAVWPSTSAASGAQALTFYDSDNHSTWVPFCTYTNASGTTVTGPVDTTGASLPAGTTIVPGSERLVRDFAEMSDATKFTNDPYQFFLAAPLTVSGATGAYDMGELAFNPKASAVMDTRGQPLQASVDYIVQDWHTIHEDKTIGEQSAATTTATASSTVRLTLSHLLKYNASDTNGILYKGIAGSGTATLPNDIVVYDLDTFAQIMPATTTQIQNGTESDDFTVDYANGAVTLYGFPVGAHIRIYYHAENYWGLAVLKPAASYTIISAANNNGSDTPSGTGQAVQDGGNLYFPACDIGRSVQIGGTLTYTPSGSTSPVTVPLSLLTPLSAPVSSSAGQPAVVDLGTAIHGGLPAGATITAATSPTATGASLTARAIWLQNRMWRSRDVTTVDLPSGS